MWSSTPLVLPISADHTSALGTLETIRLIREELGVNMTCGASNVSFGLPWRETINVSFLSMAIAAGVTVGHHQPAQSGYPPINPGNRPAYGTRSLCRQFHRRIQRIPKRGGSPLVKPPAFIENTKITIEYQPHEKSARVPPGTSIFNGANWIGLPIDSACGGLGTCGKCKVRVIQGKLDVTPADRKVFSPDELDQGWRLSCRAEAYTDTICEAPRLMGNPKAALMGFGRHVLLNPNVHKRFLELTPPELDDQRSDIQRIQDQLATEGFDVNASLKILRQIPRTLREGRWRITATIVGSELVAVEPGDTTGRLYGLAFDIGTTTVVGMLINLETGATEAIESALNRQASHGADVISRISYADLEEDGLDTLQNNIIDTINEIIHRTLTAASVSPHEVYEATFAGNATMIHPPARSLA